jgi:hypothetical protein
LRALAFTLQRSFHFEFAVAQIPSSQAPKA